MKRLIRNSNQISAAIATKPRDVIGHMRQYASKARSILKKNGYYAVCYAAWDSNTNTVEYDIDGELFAAVDYQDYRDKVRDYCNGQPEVNFRFYTVFDKSANEFADADMSEFTDKQLEVLRDGRRLGIDVGPIADPMWSPARMRAMMEALQLGIDIDALGLTDPAKNDRWVRLIVDSAYGSRGPKFML